MFKHHTLHLQVKKGGPMIFAPSRKPCKPLTSSRKEEDLLTMFCDAIVKNKSIGIYDGAYKSVELATGKKFSHK